MQPDLAHRPRPDQAPEREIAPPLMEGELAPGMQIVLVDAEGLREPQFLEIDSFARMTNKNGLHVQAHDMDTGEETIVRHSDIGIASDYTGGRGGQWRAYPLNRLDLTAVSGFIPKSVWKFNYAGFDTLDKFLDRLGEVDVVRARDTLPANRWFAIMRVEEYDSHIRVEMAGGGNHAEAAEFVPPIALLHYDNYVGVFDDDVNSDYSVSDGACRTFDIAVLLSPDHNPRIERRQITGFDPDQCGSEVTDVEMARRLRKIADHLEQSADLAAHNETDGRQLNSGRHGVWVEDGSGTSVMENDEELWLGETHVFETKLGTVARSLANLAPHCGAQEAGVAELAVHLAKVAEIGQTSWQGGLIAGAINMGGYEEIPIDWASGFREAAGRVRDLSSRLEGLMIGTGVQPRVVNRDSGPAQGGLSIL